MKMHQWYWLLIAMLLPIYAQSAEYKLVRGSRFSLCRDLEVSLNSFKNPPPMTCGIHFGPKAPNLKLPSWKPLDPVKHVDLLKQVIHGKWTAMKGYTKPMIDSKWQAYKSKLFADKGDNKIRLWKAKFDIDHTGDAETVIRLMDQNCDSFKDASRYYMPPDPSLNVLVGKDNLDEHYKRLDKETVDAFYYKGRIYLSRWFGGTDYISSGGKSVAVGNIGRLDVVNPFVVFNEFGFSQALCRLRYFEEE